MPLTLRHSPTSPYVRKVVVAAAERGLADRLSLRATNPWDPADDLPGDNPLGKVPALKLDDGTVLFDSPVIVRYLDTLHDRAPLFPQDGGRRWWVERMHALADGILDAAVTRLIENVRRPSELYWADWDARQKTKIDRALDDLALDVDRLAGDPPDIAAIAAACALGYLDFRFQAEDWRASRPDLAQWYASFADRASMQETVPKG
jgi:glutathione S-transferase